MCCALCGIASAVPIPLPGKGYYLHRTALFFSISAASWISHCIEIPFSNPAPADGSYLTIPNSIGLTNGRVRAGGIVQLFVGLVMQDGTPLIGSGTFNATTTSSATINGNKGQAEFAIVSGAALLTVQSNIAEHVVIKFSGTPGTSDIFQFDTEADVIHRVQFELPALDVAVDVVPPTAISFVALDQFDNRVVGAAGTLSVQLVCRTIVIHTETLQMSNGSGNFTFEQTVPGECVVSASIDVPGIVVTSFFEDGNVYNPPIILLDNAFSFVPGTLPLREPQSALSPQTSVSAKLPLDTTTRRCLCNAWQGLQVSGFYPPLRMEQSMKSSRLVLNSSTNLETDAFKVAINLSLSLRRCWGNLKKSL